VRRNGRRRPADTGGRRRLRLQLVSLVAGAGVRIEAESDFSESTLSPSLAKLEISQLTAILYAYYVVVTVPSETLTGSDFEAVYSITEKRHLLRLGGLLGAHVHWPPALALDVPRSSWGALWGSGRGPGGVRAGSGPGPRLGGPS
jgi:hypothetical protein